MNWGAAGIIAATAATALFAAAATAEFGEGEGFSGSRGFTCLACHTPPDQFFPPAVVVVDGVPASWTPGTTYQLDISVTGGPPENPVPTQAKGGFAVEATLGAFSPAPGFERFVRMPHEREATYTVEGAMLRQWVVEWRTPSLAEPPGPVQVWVAVVAANGNHVMGQDADGGEFGDRAAARHWVVPPAPQAWQAWNDTPLPVPVLVGWPPAALHGVVVEVPSWATGVQVVVDGNVSLLPGSGQVKWRVPPLHSGNHSVEFRTEWRGRVSAPVVEVMTVAGASGVIEVEGRGTPALPLGIGALALLGAALRRR